MTRLILILLLIPSLAGAQSFGNSVAFQGAASLRPIAGGGGGGGAPGVEGANIIVLGNNATYVTNTITIGAGAANRFLLVDLEQGVATVNAPQVLTVRGTTGSPVSITNNILWFTNGTGFCAIAGYYLIAPQTGANEVRWGPSVSITKSVFAVTSFTNVNQSTPVGTVVSKGGSGTNPTISCTSATGELVITVCQTDAGNTLTNAVGTSIWNEHNVGSDIDAAMAAITGASSVNCDWTAGNDNYAIGAVSLKP